MTTTYDFQIIANTDISGMSLVVAQNEDAFSYLTQEEEFGYFQDGSVPLSTDRISRFIVDAELAQLSAALVWCNLPPLTRGLFHLFFTKT